MRRPEQVPYIKLRVNEAYLERRPALFGDMRPWDFDAFVEAFETRTPTVFWSDNLEEEVAPRLKRAYTCIPYYKDANKVARYTVSLFRKGQFIVDRAGPAQRRAAGAAVLPLRGAHRAGDEVLRRVPGHGGPPHGRAGGGGAAQEVRGLGAPGAGAAAGQLLQHVPGVAAG